MVLYTILLYNTAPIHCTPLRLHPPVMSTQCGEEAVCPIPGPAAWVVRCKTDVITYLHLFHYNYLIVSWRMPLRNISSIDMYDLHQ